MAKKSNSENNVKLLTAVIGLVTALIGAYFFYTKSVEADNNTNIKPTHVGSPLEKKGDRR